jgi:hypothetical protein
LNSPNTPGFLWPMRTLFMVMDLHLKNFLIKLLFMKRYFVFNFLLNMNHYHYNFLKCWKSLYCTIIKQGLQFLNWVHNLRNWKLSTFKKSQKS